MKDKVEPSTNGSNGRDKRGRFATGNSGGPGNPFARQIALFRCILISAVTPTDIRRIAEGLVKRAMKGDLGAAKLVFAYCIGSPVPYQDPDTLDERELKNKGGYFKAECEMHNQKPDIVEQARWSIES